MALKKTKKQPSSKVKDPYCMLVLAVIDRQARDARKGNKKAIAWFQSDDYNFYLDFVSQCIGADLPYGMRPEGV